MISKMKLRLLRRKSSPLQLKLLLQLTSFHWSSKKSPPPLMDRPLPPLPLQQPLRPPAPTQVSSPASPSTVTSEAHPPPQPPPPLTSPPKSLRNRRLQPSWERSPPESRKLLPKRRRNSRKSLPRPPRSSRQLKSKSPRRKKRSLSLKPRRRRSPPRSPHPPPNPLKSRL